MGEHDEKLPAANVTVKLQGRGAPTVTQSQGEFELPLPIITHNGKERPLCGPGETIRLIVEKPDWIINAPVDGEVRLPSELLKDVVEIQLVPIGSHKLWSHERFQKEMRDLQEKSKEQIQPQNEQARTLSFDQHIAHIADKLGFPKEEVKARLDGWAKEAERANDPYDKALAEYYNQNFIQAKALFQQSADLKLHELESILQKEEALQKRKLQVIEEVVERLKGKGDAAFSAYQFEEALNAYKQSLTILPKGQLARLWTDLQMDIAKGNWAIGIRTEGQKLHECLTRARQAYAQGERGYAALGQQEGRAGAQGGLGLILQEQGIRTGGEKGQQLLAQAVAAYEKALEVFTREDLPGYWMLGRPNLAEVYLFQGNWEKVHYEVLDLADDPIIRIEDKIVHRLIQIVALAGEGKSQRFPNELEILKQMIVKQNQDFFLTWNFQSTKHFIRQHEAFAGLREWLVALLNGFSGMTRDTMLAAVKTAQTQFMAAGSSNKILPPQ